MSATLHFLNAKLFLCLLVTLFQHHFAFATSNPAGLSLRAVIDDSPESPLYLIGNLSRAERIEKLITITKARVNYLDLVSRPNARLVPSNINIPIFRDSHFYSVWFTIGSQKHPVKLLMDTGGGLIWTQCQPCKNCFPQNLQIYDPRVSASYGTLPCDHPLCNGDYRLYDCVNGECVYDVKYGGGSSTKGIASLESFHFFIDNHNTKTFSNVIFGCSGDNTDFSFKNSDISGIFGLNLSPDSMFSQFAPLIHNRFSYCLVPFLDAVPHPIILRFGEDIPQLPPGQVNTALFGYAPPESYYLFYLELLDISVANHRLGFHPDTFRIRQDGSGGCFIDSGALISRIDSNTLGVNAYEAVLAVYEAYYGSQKLQRTNGPSGLDLCYETPTNYHDFAAITFHLNGADYTVDGQLGHFFDPVNGFFCVAIVRGMLGTVIGAWHQQNKRIIYDKGIGGLQFADEQCINDVLQ